MLNMKPNPLYVKAMLLHTYVQEVERELIAKRRYSAADQLARSTRAVLNNVSEAQSSESRRDFVHRLKSAQRELNEASSMISTEWRNSKLLQEHGDLVLDLTWEIARILASSVATARRRDRRRKAGA